MLPHTLLPDEPWRPAAESSLLRMKWVHMKKPLSAAVLGIAVATTAIALASPADATSRANCSNGTYLYLDSSSTTCWANAGDAYPTLYGVYGLSAGNNAGYVQGSGYTVYFAKNQNGPFGITITVTHIHIN
jgi:hypothetical protein